MTTWVAAHPRAHKALTLGVLLLAGLLLLFAMNSSRAEAAPQAGAGTWEPGSVLRVDRGFPNWVLVETEDNRWSGWKWTFTNYRVSQMIQLYNIGPYGPCRGGWRIRAAGPR